MADEQELMRSAMEVHCAKSEQLDDDCKARQGILHLQTAAIVGVCAILVTPIIMQSVDAGKPPGQFFENVAAAGLDVVDIGCIAAECGAWITEFGGNEAEMRDDE